MDSGDAWGMIDAVTSSSQLFVSQTPDRAVGNTPKSGRTRPDLIASRSDAVTAKAARCCCQVFARQVAHELIVSRYRPGQFPPVASWETRSRTRRLFGQQGRTRVLCGGLRCANCSPLEWKLGKDLLFFFFYLLKACFLTAAIWGR